MKRVLAFTLLATLISTPVSGQEDDSPAGAAMSTIFSAVHAPKQKTMGLLQRSFLDLADQGDQELEIAIVIDGTDSMESQLQGVRNSIHKMLADLRQYRDNTVRAAVVVYRDCESEPSEVEIPFAEFTDNEEKIKSAVDALQPKSGAPYYYELTDLGIYEALTALKWSEDDQVARWILMFGDAPPYPAAFSDANLADARRRYSTPILVSLAKQKNIRINCVLCSSNKMADTFDKVVDETRGFMSELAAGTDGLMLDLSDDDIRAAIVAAADQPDIELSKKLEPITAIDLEAVRVDQRPGNPITKTVSLAVIPHTPFDKIDFQPQTAAVQVSTALRTKLAQIPGVRVASPRDVKEQLRRLRSDGARDETAKRRMLAARLRVDYVVWGKILPDSKFQTAAYRTSDGQEIVPVTLAKHSGDMAYALIQASAKRAPDDTALSQMLSNMRQLGALQAPMSKTPATNDDLLTAMEALEQALAFEAGSDDSVKLLETAELASDNANKAESNNAIAHWLKANVAYNQASRHYKLGEIGAAVAKRDAMKASLGAAVTLLRDDRRSQVAVSESLANEIRGDYYLISREPEKAIEYYKKLIKSDQPLQSQLRGHWMLAGIYAGDWGNAGKGVVDLAQARRHIIQIMANWPDSPEAGLLKDWLRWDDSQEKTNYNYMRNLNTGLIGA